MGEWSKLVYKVREGEGVENKIDRLKEMERGGAQFLA